MYLLRSPGPFVPCYIPSTPPPAPQRDVLRTLSQSPPLHHSPRTQSPIKLRTPPKPTSQLTKNPKQPPQTQAKPTFLHLPPPLSSIPPNAFSPSTPKNLLVSRPHPDKNHPTAGCLQDQVPSTSSPHFATKKKTAAFPNPPRKKTPRPPRGNAKRGRRGSAEAERNAERGLAAAGPPTSRPAAPPRAARPGLPPPPPGLALSWAFWRGGRTPPRGTQGRHGFFFGGGGGMDLLAGVCRTQGFLGGGDVCGCVFLFWPRCPAAQAAHETLILRSLFGFRSWGGVRKPWLISQNADQQKKAIEYKFR